MSLFYRSCTTHGHKFEARYDNKIDHNIVPNSVSGAAVTLMEGIIKAARIKIYVCDVCVYCGAVTKRPDCK